MRKRRPNVWKGIAAGAIGGLAASWLMEQFQALLSKAVKPPKDQEQEPATIKAAEAISQAVLHHRLRKREKQTAGEALHYAMGVVTGGVYGALCELYPQVSAGAGTLFGAAVWAAADEVAVPALGLSKPAREYPPSVHAKALASHLVYGVSTDLIRREVRQAL